MTGKAVPNELIPAKADADLAATPATAFVAALDADKAKNPFLAIVQQLMIFYYQRLL